MQDGKLPSRIVAEIAKMQGRNDDDPWDDGWNAAIGKVGEAIATILPDGWEFVPETEVLRAHLRRRTRT